MAQNIKIKGVSIVGSILTPSILNTLLFWWIVVHSSTENLMIGRLIAEIMTKTAAAFALLVLLENRLRIMKYSNSESRSIATDVNLASQIHQVPQAAFPHMDPVINVAVVK